jgi:glycosidase
MMKKLLALLLAVLMVCSILSACGKDDDKNKDNEKQEATSAPKDDNAEDTVDPVASIKITPSTDKYRAYYQVWIGAFHDSDGDDIGDIPGLIEKLDYINDGNSDGGDDLGADGIWLSPMMPSSTYHKYNIENYYDIDPEFGTLDDFDKLIEECHKRGVVVIIDLVLNHSGAGHEFFKKALDELQDGKEDGYARYYNFAKKQDGVYQYKVPDTDFYYQADFWDQMPDWNLSYEGTRSYFEDVTKFWLDRGVDGFRLDAVKYFDDGHTDGVEFLSWFYDMAKGYKDDVYMVGEDWDDAGNIYDMYESGIDSLFNFKFAGSGGEYLVSSHGMIEDFVKKLKKYDDNIKKHNENAINANFLTNHDMVRLANMLEEDENKMAAALYLLSPGNSFTYYGEEIGIEADSTSSDSYYRTAMIWDSDDIPTIDASGVDAPEPPLGGVKQQLAEENSLLNTYRKLIKIRLQNPEIARGDITEKAEFGDIDCAGYIVEYDGSRVLVIHNAKDETMELTIDMIDNPELRGWSYAGESEDAPSAKLSGTKLTVPEHTSVVLKEN